MAAEVDSASVNPDGKTAKELKEEKYQAMLVAGGVFLKHGKRGSPHERFVFCNIIEQRIWWRKVSERKPKKKDDRYIDFKDLLSVNKGITTEVLQRVKNPEETQSLIFSLIAGDRTLDLECSSVELREEWCAAFSYLLIWQGVRRSASTKNLLGNPERKLSAMPAAASGKPTVGPPVVARGSALRARSATDVSPETIAAARSAKGKVDAGFSTEPNGGAEAPASLGGDAAAREALLNRQHTIEDVRKLQMEANVIETLSMSGAQASAEFVTAVRESSEDSSSAIERRRMTNPDGKVVDKVIKSYVTRWRVKTTVRIAARRAHHALVADLVALHKQDHAAHTIQAAWRGYCERKYLESSGGSVFRWSAAVASIDKVSWPEELPYWEDPYGADAIRFQVSAVSPMMLIQILTHPNRNDIDLLETTLLTHNLYMSSPLLLHCLDLRFFSQPLVPERVPNFEEEIQPQLRLKVLEFVSEWLDRAPYDFGAFSVGRDTLGKNITNWASAGPLKVTARAIRLQQQYEEAMSEPNAKYVLNLEKFNHLHGAIPKSILPTVPTIETIFDLHPVEIARQITLIDFAVFYQIKPTEYLHQAWCRKGKERHAPHVLALIERFNKCQRWAATEILKQKDIEDRAHVVCFLIDIATACLTLNNYSGVMAVVTALSCASVSRLRNTFSLLPEVYEAKLDELETVMHMTNNYQNYRHEFKKCGAPAVPYIGVFLQDLTFVDDGNESMIGEMLNMDKHQMTVDIIHLLESKREAEYCLQPVSTIAHYLQMEAEVWDDKAQYAVSLDLEPRGMKATRKRKVSHEPLEPFEKPEFEDGIDPHFLRAVLQCMTTEYYEAGDVILNVGEYGHEMYFITAGVVQVVIPTGVTFQLNEGDFFGEIALFLKRPRTACVVAHTDCSVRVLTRDVCDRVLSEFPHVKQDFEDLCKARLADNASKVQRRQVPRWMKSLAQKSIV